MILLVGLGNPGKEYEKTRHNVGFLVLDALKTEMTNNQLAISNQLSITNWQFSNKFQSEVGQAGDILLVKPQTFMNKSGEAVRKITDFYKLKMEDVWVVHDDLDIKLGDYKIQFGKGPRVHNGVGSVVQSTGTEEFWRVRIGTEGRMPPLRQGYMGQAGNGYKIPGEEYVLQAFADEEQPIIKQTIDKVVADVYGRLI